MYEATDKFTKIKIKENANLTAQWTETKWVQQASSTNFTNMSNSFSRFWLWPLVEKQDSSTVYHIGLNSTCVQYLLNLRNPHYIMIWRSPYLPIAKENQKKKKEKKGKENP
jgi:hypothetical protein